MNPEEYQAILARLEKLERRDRRLRVERVATLALAGYLAATGPLAGVQAVPLERSAARWLTEISRGGRAAVARSTVEACRLLAVTPTVDARAILADEQALREDAGLVDNETALAAPGSSEAVTAPSRKPGVRAVVPAVVPSSRPTAAALVLRSAMSSPAVPAGVQRASASAPPQTQPVSAASGARADAALDQFALLKRAVPADVPAANVAPTEASGPGWTESVHEAETKLAQAAQQGARLVADLAGGPRLDVRSWLARGAIAAVPTASEVTLPSRGTAGSLRVPPAASAKRGLADPRVRWEAVERSEAGAGPRLERDPFQFAGSNPSAPPQPGSTTYRPVQIGAAPGVTVPTAPVPPPVALKALGYAQSADGTAQAVLSTGVNLYVVREGEEFGERFRVIAIRPDAVEVQDLLANQTLPIPFGP